MKKNEIVRAWRDEDFLSNLSADQLAALPANPAGVVELREEDLGEVAGGAACTCQVYCTFACSDSSNQKCCS